MAVSPASGGAEVRAVLEAAEQAAREAGAPEVCPEHVLLALTRKKPGPLGPILERYKMTPEALAAALPKPPAPENGAGAPPGAENGPLPPAPEMAAAVARAGGAASALGRESFDAADLLIALLEDRASRTTELLAARFELSQEKLVKDLRAIRGQERMVAKAEGKDACEEHRDALAATGLEGAAEGGVGVAAELRELDHRLRALFENHRMVRERQEQLVAVVRRLWVLSFLLLAAVAALGYFLFVAKK